jgi:hypothetical protein
MEHQHLDNYWNTIANDGNALSYGSHVNICFGTYN